MKSRSNRKDIPTVIGMSLLLFLLGVFGFVAILTNGLEKQEKEKLEVKVSFRDNVKEVDILMMEKELAAYDFVVSARYVSKDSAYAMMKEAMPESDFGVLDYNPFPGSVDLNLSNEYVNPDSAEVFKNMIMSGNEHLIEDVTYNKKQFEEISSGIFAQAEWIVIGLSLLLILVTMAIINNTIRLDLYAKRFTIKTMQLVGAKPSFIRRPFLIKAIGLGFASAILAIAMLVGMAVGFMDYAPHLVDLITQSEIHLEKSMMNVGILFGGIIILSIFVSWLSTYFALSKYIWIKSDKLY